MPFAGFDRDATDLILKIKEKKKEDNQYADYTDGKKKEEIVSDLWHLYKTERFYFLRERAMDILALITPDSIVDSLIEALADGNNTIRGRAAGTFERVACHGKSK